MKKRAGGSASADPASSGGLHPRDGVEAAPDSSGRLLEIVAFTQAGVTTRPLPRSGSVVLGREADADVCIPDPSVSRRHARLHLGPPLRVEDLGSRNGTRVLDQVDIWGSGSPDGALRPKPQRNEVPTAKIVDVPSDTPGEDRAPASTDPFHLAPGDVVLLGAARVLVRCREPGPGGAPGEDPRAGVIVEDPAMLVLYELAERVAKGALNVLILGETGAGKEVLAAFLHRASPRARRPMLCLSCVSLSESLLESELFGHERGAFTGAIKAKPGLLEAARGGTIFLDEIGELPPSTQAKLLRVIEDRKVTRVGGLVPIDIDVRFVAATNRDLEADVARGAFRRDLFFRLNGITLTLPPLRERRGEIEALARQFAARAAAEMGGDRAAISPGALDALSRHTWPGNIRELRNVMDRAVALAGGATIAPEHLLLGPAPRPAGEPSPAEPTAANPPAGVGLEPSWVPTRATLPDLSPPEGDASDPAARLRELMEARERQRIVDALDQCAGNQTRAAAVLGISRRTLVERLGAYGIPRPRKR